MSAVNLFSLKEQLQVRHFINAHKILTPLVVLGLMIYYGCWSETAWLYLALHGTYCFLWMIKDRTFPDRRFEEKIHPLAGFIFVFFMLGGYWVAPFIIIYQKVSAPAWLIGAATFLTIFGIFLHYVSDAQKYTTLKIKKGLITTGLFSLTRNPNYLGEMMIYLGFAILAQSWLPILVLLYWWAFFIRNMIKKDQSMARYPEFAEWKESTGLLFPKIFK
ncbi:methyltransferase family protein [Aeromonas hydrophila]|uniref:methyltransferase family protein n=1 Tax=Aeromonas hydrophila TaxID=644 RepID=UPI002B4C15EA|nr:DUF1295 domain-containing protein [Aeromonas hydrophila]WRK93452.1 DUF1295 domain-containing protein [Aeromonas hydrophila]